jgi:hypothetical protein
MPAAGAALTLSACLRIRKLPAWSTRAQAQVMVGGVPAVFGLHVVAMESRGSPASRTPHASPHSRSEMRRRFPACTQLPCRAEGRLCRERRVQTPFENGGAPAVSGLYAAALWSRRVACVADAARKPIHGRRCAGGLWPVRGCHGEQRVAYVANAACKPHSQTEVHRRSPACTRLPWRANGRLRRGRRTQAPFTTGGAPAVSGLDAVAMQSKRSPASRTPRTSPSHGPGRTGGFRPARGCHAEQRVACVADAALKPRSQAEVRRQFPACTRLPCGAEGRPRHERRA